MSDDERADIKKIQNMSFEDYLVRLEGQLFTKKQNTWEKKTISEISKFSSDPKGFQKNFEKVGDIIKKFIEIQGKLSDKYNEHAKTVVEYILQFSLQSGTDAPDKIQQQIVAKWLSVAEWTSSETTKDGTNGAVYTTLLLANCTYYYNAFIKNANLKLAVPIIKNSLLNGQGDLPEDLKMHCATAISHINTNAPKLINENAGQFWKIAVANGDKSVIISLISKVAKFKEDFIDVLDRFLDFYEDELNSTEKIQVSQCLGEACKWCPEKCIKKLSVFVDDLEGMGKFFACQALTALAKKYPDEVFKYESDINNVLNDKDHGFAGAQVYGAIGQYSQKPEIIKTCTQKMIETIKQAEINNLISIAVALKSVAQGGEKHKEILKKDFIANLNELKDNKDAQVAEQVKQTLDIIHGRSLEKVELKMDQLKKEMVDYVNSKMDEIKKNYNKAVKTLPMPVDIEVKKGFINTIFLKFECAQCKDENCVFAGSKQEGGEFFKTKTKEVNKWCKVASSVFSLGKSVFGGDVEGALGALAEGFSASMEDDQGAEHFKALMEEPFLTSSESDRLILQLREANYFNSFSFQSEFNGWVCYKCHPFERKPEPKKQGCACTIQ